MREPTDDEIEAVAIQLWKTDFGIHGTRRELSAYRRLAAPAIPAYEAARTKTEEAELREHITQWLESP